MALSRFGRFHVVVLYADEDKKSIEEKKDISTDGESEVSEVPKLGDEDTDAGDEGVEEATSKEEVEEESDEDESETASKTASENDDKKEDLNLDVAVDENHPQVG